MVSVTISNFFVIISKTARYSGQNVRFGVKCVVFKTQSYTTYIQLFQVTNFGFLFTLLSDFIFIKSGPV